MENEKTWILPKEITVASIERPPFWMSFTSPINGKYLGELKEENGKLTFSGNAEESAKVFFECVIKEYNKNKKIWND